VLHLGAEPLGAYALAVLFAEIDCNACVKGVRWIGIHYNSLSLL
jgi:hypothetical protein